MNKLSMSFHRHKLPRLMGLVSFYVRGMAKEQIYLLVSQIAHLITVVNIMIDNVKNCTPKY